MKRTSGLRARCLLAAVGLGVGAACHGPTTPTPTPPPVQNIELSCPASIHIDNVVGSSQPVTFQPPVAIGGAPPISLQCSPASGASFPVGTTVVTCNATDGVRAATCPFSVTLVAAVPKLSLTSFLAFGDSITEGEVQPALSTLDIIDALSYPTQLKQLLEARYTSQSFTMVNRGQQGESAQDGSLRITGEIAHYRPDALLLMQGIIDLGGGPDLIPYIRSGLDADITRARGQGVKAIFLSTILPESDCSDPCRNFARDWVGDANVAIRSLAADDGVFLVDGYKTLNANLRMYIGADGLHPTAAGYAALAAEFLAVIKDKLELPPLPPSPSALGPTLLRAPGVPAAHRSRGR